MYLWGSSILSAWKFYFNCFYIAIKLIIIIILFLLPLLSFIPQWGLEPQPTYIKHSYLLLSHISLHALPILCMSLFSMCSSISLYFVLWVPIKRCSVYTIKRHSRYTIKRCSIYTIKRHSRYTIKRCSMYTITGCSRYTIKRFSHCVLSITNMF